MTSDYARIANMPATLKREYIQEGLTEGCKGWHESLLRSWHILLKVKWLLEKKTDPEVIAELISLMESDNCQPYAHFEEEYKWQNEKGQIQESR